MSAPWGHTHRDEPGPRGWLARRWGNHRRRRVARALARHGTPSTPPARPPAPPTPRAPALDEVVATLPAEAPSRR